MRKIGPSIRYIYKQLAPLQVIESTRFVSNKAVQHKQLPRITVPHKMINKIQTIRKKKAINEARAAVPPGAPLILSCKRREFNHYQGQTTTTDEKLASTGWTHSKSVGDFFTIKPYRGNPSLLQRLDHTNFATCGLGESTVGALHQLHITVPTNIQHLGIPKILTGNNVLCTAETGSGKTLMYLLPIVELIQRQKLANELRQQPKNSPRFIIIVPTHEIAQQIQSVCEALSQTLLVHSLMFVGQYRFQDMVRMPRESIDVIVTTPGALLTLLKYKVISSSRLQMLVLDEVDTLLDDSFNATIRSVVEELKITFGSPSGDSRVVSLGTQVVLVGATIPRDIQNIIGDFLPVADLENVMTRNVHRLLPHVSQKFVRVSPSTKPDVFLTLLQSANQDIEPTLVFCNKNRTVYWLSQFLSSNGIDNTMLYSGCERDGTFDSFQMGASNILVATDICSRGLDTQRVRHVINYEFPNFLSDYIHRVGRVGRVCVENVQGHQASRVTNLISHKWEIPLVVHIETAARRSKPLEGINANIKRRITSIVTNKFPKR